MIGIRLRAMERSNTPTDAFSCLSNNHPNTCHRCHLTSLLVKDVLEHLDELNRCIIQVQVHTVYLQEEIVQVKHVIESLQLEELKRVHRGVGEQ
ncbi:hypothetical protein Gasu2_42610 [Galdieria sulphuraria]|nr:hypothetical protein Gasu2_42610 [Galdieria sulphuraria]